MRKFLTILMSLQLILFPVTGAMGNEELPGAEESQTTEPEKEITGEEVSQMLSGDQSGDSGFAYYLNQLLVIATSCTGTTLILSCVAGWSLPSIYLFVAGAVSHLASEAVGAQDFANRMAKSIDSNKLTQENIDKLKAEGKLHIGAVQAALDDQNNLLEYAKSKRNWLIAVMSLYWASATFSVLEDVTPPLLGVGACSGTWVSAAVGEGATIAAFFASPLTGIAYALSSENPSDLTSLSSIFVGLIPFIIALKTSEVPLFNVAITRSITFGALAAIATWVMSDMAVKVSDIEENIEKLKEVKKDLEKKNEEDEEQPGFGMDPTTYAAASGSGGGTASVYSSETKVAASSTKCIAYANDGSKSSSSSNCSNPAKYPAPKLEGDLNQPELNNMLQSAASMVNSAARGDTAGANARAAEIGAQAGRMRDMAKKAMKRYNEIMKEQGKPQIDFEKEIANRAREFQETFRKGLGSNAPQLAASNSKAVLDALKPEDAKGKIGAVAAAKPEAAAGAPKNLFKGFDSGPPVEQPSAPQPTVSDSLDQYKSSVSDINNDKDVSIFALLSNRYVLSYDRVMDRKKKVEAQPAPSK